MRYLTLLLLFHLSLQGTAQKHYHEALSFYSKGEPYKALSVLKERLNDPKHVAQPKELALYAQCLNTTSQYYPAAFAYYDVFKVDTLQEFPRALHEMGRMYKMAGHYEMALSVFKGAKRFYSSADCSLCRELDDEIKSMEYALSNNTETLEKPTNKLSINTGSNELSARFVEEEKWFFNRYEKSEGGQYKNQLYLRYLDNQGTRADPGIFQEINKLGQVANAALTPDKQHVVFTYCPTRNCEIWIADLKNGKFTRPRLLPGFSSLSGSYTHPYLIDNDGSLRLFFSTNDSSLTSGGYDLFFSDFSNGAFGEKIPLTAINSPGDEITPFLKNGTLYFSSDYLPGFGGFDIFRIDDYNNELSVPENLGLPINSPSNDVYYNENEAGDQYLLSSNREEALSSKNLNCCNDVFLGKTDRIEVQEVKETQVDIINELLPIGLYFHNDYPNPKSVVDTSNVRFLTTLKNYVAMYPEYLNKTSSSKQQIDFFFRQLREDESALRKVIIELSILLEKGTKMNLYLAGFASPLAQNDYNFHLSARRLDSWIKELRYQGLGNYIDNGQLSFVFSPKGEEVSSEMASDDFNNPSESIYGIEAMKERKIEVTKIEIK